MRSPTERVLIVAPHPDDDVLGCGGTAAKLAAQGANVHVAVLTTAGPPLFDQDVAATGRRESLAAHQVLGVKGTTFAGLPAASLDTVAHADVNASLGEVFADVEPDTVFVPFVGDLHRDHQLAFLSSLVASRPTGPGAPRAVYAYETLSETNWNAPYVTPGFHPTVFVDISDHLETKVAAMRCHASQVRPFPHERSLEALRALAVLRGSTVGCQAAEGFVLVRQLL